MRLIATVLLLGVRPPFRRRDTSISGRRHVRGSAVACGPEAPVSVCARDHLGSATRMSEPAPPEPFTRTYRVAMAACRPLAAWGRLRVAGLEALPRGGPVLLAGNHDSQMDPVIIGLAAARRRQIRALAK